MNPISIKKNNAGPAVMGPALQGASARPKKTGGVNPFKNPLGQFFDEQGNPTHNPKDYTVNNSKGLVWNPGTGTFEPVENHGGDMNFNRGFDQYGNTIAKDGYSDVSRNEMQKWRSLPGNQFADLPKAFQPVTSPVNNPQPMGFGGGPRNFNGGSYRGNAFNVGRGGRKRSVFG